VTLLAARPPRKQLSRGWSEGGRGKGERERRGKGGGEGGNVVVRMQACEQALSLCIFEYDSNAMVFCVHFAFCVCGCIGVSVGGDVVGCGVFVCVREDE